MIRMPIVDHGKCDCCGLCVNICYCNALVIVDGFLTVVQTEECGWCTDCELVCPRGAIGCPYDIIIEEEVRKIG
jgi:MinD superfamily P-loop ATPase